MSDAAALYEFVTPSDPILFRAATPKIAFVCGLIVGNGKAGLHMLNDAGNRPEDDPTPSSIVFLMDAKGCSQYVLDELGTATVDEYIDAHTADVVAALRSFAYGSFAERQAYEKALSCITDPEKLAEFKAFHEDKNRTSLSQLVQYAWDLADAISDAASPPVETGDTTHLQPTEPDAF